MILSKYNSYINIDDNYFLIFNILSGNTDIINNDLYNLLKKDCNLIKDKKMFDYFIERGYITTNYLNEDHEISEKKKNIYRVMKNSPKIHTIIVTYDCNFNCEYCFEGKNNIFKKIDKKVLDKAFECIMLFDKKQKYKNPIGIFGGEPLLLENYEVIKYILDKGNSLGYKFFIPTNGYYLEEYVTVLKNYKYSKIQVTIDGPDFIHNKRRTLKNSDIGTFNKIMKGISKALKFNLPIVIRVNVDHDNVHYLNDLIEFFQKNKWFKNENFKIYLSPCREDPGRCFRDFTKEMYLMIFKNIKSELYKYINFSNEPLRRLRLSIYNCDACFKQLFYDPEGYIYPCSESIGNKEMIIGKYIPKIEFNNNYNQLLKRNALNQEIVCSSCNNFQICRGGCPYRALVDKGTLKENDCGTFLEIKKNLANIVTQFIKK